MTTSAHGVVSKLEYRFYIGRRKPVLSPEDMFESSLIKNPLATGRSNTSNATHNLKPGISCSSTTIIVCSLRVKFPIQYNYLPLCLVPDLYFCFLVFVRLSINIRSYTFSVNTLYLCCFHAPLCS